MHIKRFVKSICFVGFFFLLFSGLQAQESNEEQSAFDQKYIQLKSLLLQLEESYGIGFAFDAAIIPDRIPASFDSNKSLDVTLKELFFLAGLEYQVSDSLVLIRKSLRGKDNAMIRGQVKDELSGKGLPYVLIQGDHFGGLYTDSLGYFELPEKGSSDKQVRFHFIGYRDKTYDLKHLQEVQEISLRQGLNPIEVIKIQSTSYQPERILMDMPAASGLIPFKAGLQSMDLLREIQMQAGISAHDDNNARISIRGSEDFETLIDLDGIVIYNPTHFYNFFSAINAPYVSRVSLYKNNLPIEYSGRTGGMVKMESKKKSPEQFSAITQIDLLNASSTLAIPFNQKSSLFLSARTSYTNLAKSDFFSLSQNQNSGNSDKLPGAKYLIQELDPNFNYFDLNGKWQYHFAEGHRLNVNYYQSRDRLLVNQQTERENDLFSNRFLFDYNDKSYWDNLGISSNFTWVHHSNRFSKFTFNYSRSDFEEIFSYYNLITLKQGQKEFEFKNDLSNQVSDLHLKWLQQWDINKSYSWTMGLESGLFQTFSNIRFFDQEIYREKNTETVLSHFQEITGQWGKFESKLGFRLSHLTSRQKTLLDPRFSIHYRGLQKGILYSSLGLNHQYLNQFSYENHLGQAFDFWTLANDHVSILSSLNAMLGYKYAGDNFLIQAEAFIKKRDKITEFAILKPGFTQDGELINDGFFNFFTGEGLIRGLDLSLIKNWKYLETTFHYTLSKNTLRFDEIFQGNAFPNRNHRNHQLKWINQLRMNAFSIHINNIYSSGKPYFDVSNLSREQTRKELDLEKYIKYLPYYYRLDLGLSYEGSLAGREAAFGISVFNLTNRRNLYQAQYIRPIQNQNQNGEQFIAVGAESALLDRTFNASFQIKF